MIKLRYLFLSVLFFISELSIAQLNDFASKAQKLIGTFNAYHLKPISISETTASETVDLFVEEIDGNGFVLKTTDIDQLKVNSSQFYNLIYKNDNEFAKKALAVYLAALNSMDSILGLIAVKKLNFTENDTMYLIPFSSPPYYSLNLKKHAKRIEKNMKNHCMDRVVNTDGYEKYTEAEFIKKSQDFSKDIVLNYQKRVKNLIEDAPETIEATLLNAIALRYDPHSNYFTQEQNKEFSQRLSKEVETFGFYLDEDENGNIIVANIKPGGSAWMSNNINEGDIFISLTIDNTTISNDGKSAEEVQDMLDRSISNKLTITLKKQNGQLKIVKLIKQKTTSDENTIKGYILKNNSDNIGYISLPSFYNDMFDKNSPGCANDVAKEILKLEGDTIKGLIIDLRHNGGGSMAEAMNLAGIFIDEGPLFIYKEKNKKPHLYKDINRGSIFHKPIVVLINETSASASELFCNIVKDYNLGLVVGQTSYGKGSAQVVLPLDTNAMRSEESMKKATDFIKVTHAMFYRLNCTSHQGIGVIPDVVLPGIPGYSNYRENEEHYFLSPETIVKNVVYTPNPATDVATIQQNSKKRIADSPDFKKFKRSSDSLLLFMNSTQKIVLKYTEYKRYKNETEQLYQSFVAACKAKNTVVKCVDNTFDKKITNVNEQTKEFNLKIRESIEEDIFINESFYIINDLISLTK